ncbi:DUF488 family protein [uncultured Desulfobulbus sp.]|uniref:DUF488 domain-containing protein n=1 Tax=uncultured Desulfobulbus sp. TaxID=239745 RepID=UPI0029C8F10C|nr:DUF488 family protein [uncultured Desulfobulbus sp.]
MTLITTKRVYDPIDNNEGVRVLVDRLWPRGVSKQTLKADHWLREVAPSDQLRQWFGHDPNRWDEFKHRYFEELQAKPEIVNFLLELARAKGLVLLFSARDLHCNQAIALQQYLLSLIQKTKGASQDNDR